MALVATTVFLTVLAVVTGVELVAGRPLSDLLRGDSGHGTSVFGGDHGEDADRPPDGADRLRHRHAKVVEQTTPTYTRTASPATTTATPTSAVPSTPATPYGDPELVTAPSSSGPATP